MRNKTPAQNSRAANSNTTYQNIQLPTQIKIQARKGGTHATNIISMYKKRAVARILYIQ